MYTYTWTEQTIIYNWPYDIAGSLNDTDWRVPVSLRLLVVDASPPVFEPLEEGLRLDRGKGVFTETLDGDIGRPLESGWKVSLASPPPPSSSSSLSS